MADPAAVRDRVMELATGFANDGCHYLWSAPGVMSDGQEGSRQRSNSVHLVKPARMTSHPSAFATVCNVQGSNVCAGRYNPDKRGIVVAGPSVRSRARTTVAERILL